MKNLLFVGWYPNAIEKYRNVFFRNLIYAIAEEGVKCTVISPVSYVRYGVNINKIPQYTQETTPRGSVVSVYYPRIFSASSKQIGNFNTEVITERLFEEGAIKQALKLEEKFDAVYGHFFLYGGLAAIRIGRKLGIPSFVAFGECDYESQIQKTHGDLTKEQIDGLSGVISVSTKNANRLKKTGLFDNIPIIIAPNSIDNGLFYQKNKKECREKFGLPQDKFIVGFVGGFIERKGDKRLLEAVNRFEDIYLVFAGRGSEPPHGEKVLFCEPLEHELIPDFMNALDLFCLPTLSEGSCNAVIEAMACGIPVISSNCDFNDDVLDDKNSIRINPNSVDEIYDAIKTLYTSREKREELSREALLSARQLNISMRAQKILKFIYGIVE